MTRRILLGLFILPVLALLLPYSTAEARPRVASVYEPEIVGIEGMSYKQVKKGIKKGLFSKGWQAKDIKKGLIRGTYTKVGKKTTLKATVNIYFTNKTVRIKYHDSQDFRYDKAAGTIHTRFNSWVKNIEKHIRSNLNAY